CTNSGRQSLTVAGAPSPLKPSLDRTPLLRWISAASGAHTTPALSPRHARCSLDHPAAGQDRARLGEPAHPLAGHCGNQVVVVVVGRIGSPAASAAAAISRSAGLPPRWCPRSRLATP